MADPYARLRTHIERGQVVKGPLEEDLPARSLPPEPPQPVDAEWKPRHSRKPQPENDDWLQFSRAVCSTMQIPPGIYDEAIQEGALAAWLADEKWSPDGGMGRRTWAWQQTQYGVLDFLRQRHGRHGRRAEWEMSLRYLDAPVYEEITLGETIPDDTDLFAAIEEGLDLCRLVRTAGLNGREHEIVVAFLTEEALKATGARWGVTESRACQVRSTAFEKLRAAA